MAKRNKQTAKTLPAVPYEPTPAEQRAVAGFEKRRADVLPTPNMVQAGEAQLSIDHPDELIGYQMIADAIGSGDIRFTIGLVLDAANVATNPDGTANAGRSNYALSIVKGIKPRNQVEAMLAMQMAAIHLASMTAARRLSVTETYAGVEIHERSLNKLSRTFAMQMEALKRYRSKGGNQRIVVERVNVSEGGQAIVGNVDRGEVG